MGSFLGVFAFCVLLLLAIGFHEFGHFITARWAGIKVSKFFIGFGPTIWSVRRGEIERVSVGPGEEPIERPETEYGVKALPLGGFVKIVGMSPFEEITPEEEPRSFVAAPAWKRAIVLSAGSATHVLTAIVMLFLIFSVVGLPTKATTTIEALSADIGGKPSPAVKAGLKPGDRIVAVDGTPLKSWDDLRKRIETSPNHPLSVTVESTAKASCGSWESSRCRRTLQLVPAIDRSAGKPVGRIGVFPHLQTERVGPITATRSTFRAIGGLLSAFVKRAPQAFSPQSLGLNGKGPSNERPISIIGAGRFAAGLASQGQIAMFMFFFAQLNLFIGLFNMLPLPPLDGGHLVVLGIEKIRRRPVRPQTVMAVTAVVLGLIVLLSVLLVYYDVTSPISVPVR